VVIISDTGIAAAALQSRRVDYARLMIEWDASIPK
jgi:hypothetical protein